MLKLKVQLKNSWTSVVCAEARGEKKSMAAELRFAKLYLYKLQDFWNNVLWLNESEDVT